LANSLSIVQTRQTFTEDLVNELEAGAEKLTVADTNEEGAKLLALQTRQQLGVTSLSLAVQSQQSVLRLF
jgi:flagellin